MIEHLTDLHGSTRSRINIMEYFEQYASPIDEANTVKIAEALFAACKSPENF